MYLLPLVVGYTADILFVVVETDRELRVVFMMEEVVAELNIVLASVPRIVARLSGVTLGKLIFRAELVLELMLGLVELTVDSVELVLGESVLPTTMVTCM